MGDLWEWPWDGDKQKHGGDAREADMGVRTLREKCVTGLSPFPALISCFLNEQP